MSGKSFSASLINAPCCLHALYADCGRSQRFCIPIVASDCAYRPIGCYPIERHCLKCTRWSLRWLCVYSSSGMSCLTWLSAYATSTGGSALVASSCIFCGTFAPSRLKTIRAHYIRSSTFCIRFSFLLWCSISLCYDVDCSSIVLKGCFLPVLRSLVS